MIAEETDQREPIGLLNALGLGLGAGIFANVGRRALFGHPLTAQLPIRNRRVPNLGSTIPDLLTVLSGLPAGAVLNALDTERWHNARERMLEEGEP